MFFSLLITICESIRSKEYETDASDHFAQPLLENAITHLMPLTLTVTSDNLSPHDRQNSLLIKVAC